MLAWNIDFISNLWAASLAPHNNTPPFKDAKSTYKTIDSTPLGNVPWQNFMLNYNSDIPDGVVPTLWMEMDYDVWYRDPCLLIHNLISNPDFKDEFDYMPYHEYDTNGEHQFWDIMSGNWAWKQAVGGTYYVSYLTLMIPNRIRSYPTTQATRVRCLCQLFLEVIRQPSRLLWGKTSIGRYICLLETFETTFSGLIAMALYSLHSYPSLKVHVHLCNTTQN